MCGIVGYLGPQDPKQILLNGLAALEYRGYDSAGVAIWNDGQYKRVRAEGKLSFLAEKLVEQNFDGHVGIGHTRWATHGPPSERNAHPHCVKGVSIVHNGIIENYHELRTELLAQGEIFSSDTDSELIAHLIVKQLDNGLSFKSAVEACIPRLEGAYAVLAVSADHPGEMLAFKNGPPLILGVTEHSLFLASDIQALVDHTRQIYYLGDHELVHIRDQHFEFFTLGGTPIQKTVTQLEWDEAKAEKAGYAHFMLKEIFEQPRAVAQALMPHIDLQTATLKWNSNAVAKPGIEMNATSTDLANWLSSVERVFIVGCGTSFYAGQVGEYLIEDIAGLPVEIDIASEFRYRKPALPAHSLVVIISQSGETADSLAALRMVKALGAKTLSICNVRHSSIDREADHRLYMNAGAEIGVASTKAFTATLGVLNLLALGLAKAKDRINQEQEQTLVKALLAAPSLMEKVLNYDQFFADVAARLKRYRGFLYMGRGPHYPVAMEGALKLKELAYMHAEGYAAGEMKHGPLALIDNSMCVVMLAPADSLYDKTLSNLEEARARGAQVIAIGTGTNPRLEQLSEHYLALPEASPAVTPFLEVIPLQLLAYHVAVAMGHDVDQPRNLAKSVTVE